MKIIFIQDNGYMGLITPAPNFLLEINPSTNKEWTVDEVAKKDVPTGKKYKIVNNSEIPSDLTFFNAWTVDESDLTDGVGE